MTKAELLTVIQGKAGFVAVVSDNSAPDSLGGERDKRFLVVETINNDGTKGLTNVFYIHNTQTDDAWFYNTEPATLETESAEAKVAKALTNYCKKTFDAFFVGRVDGVNLWAEVEAFDLVNGNLEKKNVLVFKKGTSPITHLNIV